MNLTIKYINDTMKRSRRELSVDMIIDNLKITGLRSFPPFFLPSYQEHVWDCLKRGVALYCERKKRKKKNKRLVTNWLSTAKF